jgi:type II secretory pathway predicted ATPase ExeA
MYEKEFGLTRRPFPATPDRALYYPAGIHETARTELLRAIAEGEGIALLTGAPGTGKTLLVHILLEAWGRGAVTAFLTNSHFADRSAFFQAVLYDLSLPYAEGSEQVLRLRLTDYLLENCAAGRRAVLLVDEAQHLSDDLLEEVRLLGNLEAGADKALQAILVAQDDLLTKLTRPEVAALSQRLATRVHLEALGLEESVDYLAHQVRMAGGRPEQLFEESALHLLARGSRGIPRLLNQAAHHALTLACQAEMTRVDTEAALEALSRLGLEAEVTQAGADEELPTLSLGIGGEGTASSDKSDSACRLFESSN